MVLALVIAVASAACEDAAELVAPTPSPVTETFSTQIATGGAASRTFTVRVAGTIRVTLASTTPGGVVLGLSLGVPRTTGAGCLPTRSVATAAGAAPQITLTAEAGVYCAQVYDIGTVADSVAFTLNIERP